jgi:hypothetical protein
LFAKATATLNLNSTGFGKKSGGFGGGSAGWVPPPSVPSPLLLDSPQPPSSTRSLPPSLTHAHACHEISLVLALSARAYILPCAVDRLGMFGYCPCAGHASLAASLKVGMTLPVIHIRAVVVHRPSLSVHWDPQNSMTSSSFF